MTISIVAAVARNGVIGKAGGLPWRLSADLGYFKRLTMGHHMVMGRKTFESIGRPLPGRTSVVVTRGIAQFPEGVIVARSIDDAIAACVGDDEIFVTGGAEIYRQAFPLADRLYITEVDAVVDGDTHFPEIKADEWHVVSREQRQADEKNEYGFAFVVYARTWGQAGTA